MYDPSSGDIFFDGINIKDLDISNFHKYITVVNQNPLLFDTSIRENIAYGATEKEVKDEGTGKTYLYALESNLIIIPDIIASAKLSLAPM